MPISPDILPQAARQRKRCTAKNRKSLQCRLHAVRGSDFCKYHKEQAEGLVVRSEAQLASRKNLKDNPNAGASPSTLAKNGIDTQLKMKNKELAKALLNDRAKTALSKLGLEASEGFDPKTALLATVESAHRQRLAWEAMLAAIPDEDWDYLGEMPIPGLKSTARGARIDLITKHLEEATKNAAKISKLAIDAGIEERMVRLAEEQSALIADTVKAAVIAAVGALRLSPKAEQAAIAAALGAGANHLRALAAGQDPETIEGVAVRIGAKPSTT